jgi:hypothetical protein
MGTGEAQSACVGFDVGRGTASAVMTNTATPGPQAIIVVEALTPSQGAMNRQPAGIATGSRIGSSSHSPVTTSTIPCAPA